MAKKVRKRAPGGGRKPKPMAEKKTDRVTIRIDAETKAALLEKLALARTKNQKVSMSSVAERQLKNAMFKPEGMPDPHNRALGVCIIHLAEGIERETGRRWRKDPFTAIAVIYALRAFLDYFAAHQEGDRLDIPERVAESAARVTSESAAEFYRRPEVVGQAKVQALISDIKYRPRPAISEDDFNQMFNEWSSATWPLGTMLAEIAALAAALK